MHHKLFFIICLTFAFLISPLQVSAQNCNRPNQTECVNAGCRWAGTHCVSATTGGLSPSENLGSASTYFDQFITSIGLKFEVTTLPGLINAIIPTLFIIAGLILLGMLILGGFQFLTAAADPKQAEKGQQRITTAIVGFLIIFTAYWVTQIVEIVLGVKILGG